MPVRINERDFPPPGDGDRLWRYIDLAKYLSLISKSSLWFSRATELGDPFEGSMSQANVRLRPVVYSKVPPESLALVDAFMTRHRAEMPRYTFISCWDRNERESQAMWDHYGTGRGIALVSSFGRMKQGLGGEEDILVGCVNYADYEADWIPEANSFTPFFYKGHHFEHEHEVRAAIQRAPHRQDPTNPERSIADYSIPSPLGVEVPVDMDALIAEVRLAPATPPWVREVVESATRKYELSFSILPSAIDGVPVY
jgi:hypothetical protein